MNLRISLLLLLFVGNIALAQEDTISTKQTALKFLFDKSRQRFGDAALSYQMPETTGENFMGSGLEGKRGFNFSVRCFLFKQLFVNYTYGRNKFDVLYPSIIGNITSVRSTENFLNIGYEFLPLKNIRLGAQVAVVGETKFYNTIESSNDRYVEDSGNLSNFSCYLSYEITNYMALFVEYAFRQTKTDIRVPSELQSVFEKGTYETINIGLRFSFGRHDVYDHIYL